jgi:hypothetical protein
MNIANRALPTVDDCRVVDLPRIADPRGNLTFVESGRQTKFEILRTYWIYNVPGGEKRAGHAYYLLEEMIIAISGSFDVELDDGTSKRRVSLNRSYRALYVPNLIWRTVDNFSTNAVCLVVASALFDEADYIRAYDVFLRTRTC